MNNSNLISTIEIGNRERLKEIYSRYRNEFIGWLVVRFNIPIDEAKDIYQYAILKLYENELEGKLETIKNLKAYLFAIGRNKAFEFNRSNSQKFSPAEELQLEDEFSDHHSTEEYYLQIESGLKILGDPCESLLKLYYYHQFNMDEITQKLGYKNSDTTKNQKYKCLQRLKKLALKNSMTT